MPLKWTTRPSTGSAPNSLKYPNGSSASQRRSRKSTPESSDYHAGALAYIEGIRTDLVEATTSLRALLETFQIDGVSVEKRLVDEASNLRSLRRMASLDEIRSCLERSTREIEECAERVRREKDAVIAQLRIEIHILQQRLEVAERADMLDLSRQVLRRDEFTRLLRRDLVRGAEVSVIHIA